jgi:hypothetical protein
LVSARLEFHDLLMFFNSAAGLVPGMGRWASAHISQFCCAGEPEEGKLAPVHPWAPPAPGHYRLKISIGAELYCEVDGRHRGQKSRPQLSQNRLLYYSCDRALREKLTAATKPAETNMPTARATALLITNLKLLSMLRL